MVTLKSILDMSFAQKFIIRDTDSDLVLWQGEKYTEGYQETRRVYDNYEVVGIRARGFDRGKALYKGMLVIDIQKESLL